MPDLFAGARHSHGLSRTENPDVDVDRGRRAVDGQIWDDPRVAVGNGLDRVHVHLTGTTSSWVPSLSAGRGSVKPCHRGCGTLSPVGTMPLAGRRVRRADLLCVVLLIAMVTGLELAVRHAALRPLWYDELWRAHYLSVPVRDVWADIRQANAPSPLGWAVATRGAAELLGWHAWVLRLPQLVTLPLLGAGMYALTRRFTGPLTAFVAGALLGVSGTVIDLGSQLKPYTVEAICAIAVVTLWLTHPVGTGRTADRLGPRTLAGALTVFTIPLAFLIGPLALADVLMVGGGRRARLRAALVATPAVLLTATHTVFFVARQSVQRRGDYWNGQFLAGRGFTGGLRFVGNQLLALAGSTPPGVDRTDPNLVHGITDGTAVAVWVLAPAVAVATFVGVRVLLRRTDGRVVLIALLGAQMSELAASADRYWPFGANRTNLFLVPLLTLVPAVGVRELVVLARRHRALAPAALALVAITSLALLSAASATVRLVHHQRDLRSIDQLGAATDAAGRLVRPGDVIVVAGPLVRPGWLFSTQVRAERVRPGPGSMTIFVPFDGRAAELAALRGRAIPPGQVLLFVLDIDQPTERPQLTWLRSAGFCPVSSRHFQLTGRLTVLRACPRQAGRPSAPSHR